MSKPTIAICASASKYEKVIAAADEIERLGINVVLPKTAENMKQSSELTKGFSVDSQTKATLMRGHFKEIENSDAILVMNYDKNGKPDYIGANVLIEMAMAFYLHKPIHVLNGIPDYSPLIDEILGMQPIFLYGNLQKLRLL